MANNNEQNQINREVDENGLDLTLRLGVGDSRTQSNPSQNRVNSELGFGMMSGEHNNPLPNVGSGSNGSTIGSSNTVPLIQLTMNPAADEDYVEMSVQDFVIMIVIILTRNLPALFRNWNGNNNNNNQEVDIVVDIEMSAQPDDLDLAPENNDGDLADDYMENAAPDNLDPAPENNDGDSADEYMEYTDDDEAVSDDNMDDIEFTSDDLSYEDLRRVQELIGNVSTGLSERTIEELLVRYIYPFYNLGATTCCICQEDFKHGEMIGFLECMHDDFHYRCIKNWLVQKNECPLCKSVAIPLED